MKKALFISCALAVAGARAATMASQPWTTNRIAEAEARIADKITAATNAIPTPDYSTGNAQLVETIEATAPAPGDYATVSNRAMSAIQQHQSLQPATNYTDRATNAVLRAAVSAITNGWEDVTPWTVYANGVLRTDFIVLSAQGDSSAQGVYYYLYLATSDDDPPGLVIRTVTTPPGELPRWPDDITYTLGYESWFEDLSEGDVVHVTRTRKWHSSWGFATTNDLQNVSGGVSEATVTNIAKAVVREKSLGGIWDRQLGVWWTPVMVNGALTYQATTNVNINAEGDE